MGCFSSSNPLEWGLASKLMEDGDDAPQMQLPAAPKYKTAEELYASAIPFAQTNYPLAYGAREGALADLAKGNAYYEGYQPTSFEDAMANQYFKNVWPDTEAQIKHSLSLSGMAYSPVLAAQTGKAYGDLSTSIGEYLSNLGNERANASLNARLGIDPYNVTGPYADVDLSQSNTQVEADYQRALAQAQLDYQQALQDYQNQQAQISAITSLLGGAAGFAVGGPAGAGIGASLGGTAGSLFGGGSTPVSFSDALSIASLYPSTQPTKLSGQIGKGFTDWSSGMQSNLGKSQSVSGRQFSLFS